MEAVTTPLEGLWRMLPMPHRGMQTLSSVTMKTELECDALYHEAAHCTWREVMSLLEGSHGLPCDN